MSLKLALLGRGIQHSKSKEMYDKIYQTDVAYKLLDHENFQSIPSLEEIFKQVQGLSITAPYKDHFLDQLIIDEEVKKLNAINCIKKANGQFYGTNTDFLAVREILHELDYKNRNIVLLGSGAMAEVTISILNNFNMSFTHIYRARDGAMSDLNFSKYENQKPMLVINSCARVFEFRGTIARNTIFWDYNYSHTANAKYLSNRCEYLDGLELLYRQAIHASKYWNFPSS